MWVGSASSVFSEKRFRDRIRFLSVAFGLAYAVVVLRLFQLQIVKGEDFSQMSEMNRTQVMFLRAPRGNFWDRKGKMLITNRPSWALMFSGTDQKITRDQAERKLEPFLKSFSPQWKKRLQKAYQTKQIVRLVEDVPNDVAFALREMGELLPGARMQMEFRRSYPSDFAASHLIGYLGEIDEKEIRDEYWEDRRPGDLIGKMGLEKILDGDIRGEDGGVVIEVDSAGRLKRVIREMSYQTGNSVHLTVDDDVQKIATQALNDAPSRRGAAVVLDVQTGAIRAWVSSPKFNPESLKDELTDEELPLFDRVYKGAYPPGSLFKVITAMAGFEKGAIRTSETVDCIGFLTLKDRSNQEKKYRCWKRHGVVNYWSAMTQSCDSYFYLLGQKIGSQAIYDMGRLFSLGQGVQKIFTGENAGHLPNPVWKKQKGLGGWSTGDTFNMAIGQGFVTCTPLQMAIVAATIASKGKMYQPYVVDRISNIAGESVVKGTSSLLRTVELKESTWSMLHEAMRMVITSGTGKACDIPYLDIRGKTGTAQNPHGDDHAWFAAFAGYPNEPPALAICVFVENGGGGGGVAAPIARKILEVALPDRNAVPKVASPL